MSTLTDDEASTREPLTVLSRPMAEARFQAAIVRALLDELQHADASANLQQQVIEELNVLSHRILVVADTLQAMHRAEAEPQPPPFDQAVVATESGPRISDEYPRWTSDTGDDDRKSA
ncbi:MAG: hypothetical protein ABI183_01615 [Polyangiaceae bacterium]